MGYPPHLHRKPSAARNCGIIGHLELRGAKVHVPGLQLRSLHSRRSLSEATSLGGQVTFQRLLCSR